MKKHHGRHTWGDVNTLSCTIGWKEADVQTRIVDKCALRIARSLRNLSHGVLVIGPDNLPTGIPLHFIGGIMKGCEGLDLHSKIIGLI